MKHLYITLIAMLITFSMNSQNLISKTVEHFDDFTVTTKTFDNNSTELHVRATDSGPTNLTNWLVSQAPCGFSGGCPVIILGCCQGDGLDSSTNNGECTFPEFQEYYCTVDLELVWDVFRLEHCTFTMLNGTSIINNGIQIVESTFCDVGDEVTEYIFEGGGLEFANTQEYDEYFSTLSTKDVDAESKKLTVFNLSVLANNMPFELYNRLGQKVLNGNVDGNTVRDIVGSFNGLYYLKVKGFDEPLYILN